MKPAPSKSEVNYCKIYGSICYVKKSSEADFVVFVESEEAFANLVVFKEMNFSYANQVGKWHFVDDVRLADYRVYLTKNISESDFTIAFTETESFAGCGN